MCSYPPRLSALFSFFVFMAPLGCGGTLTFESPKIQNIAPDVASTLPVLLAFLAQDETCGTASAPSKGFEPVVTGLPGEKGTLLWQRESCRVQIPTPLSLGEQCGADINLSGTFTVSFHKRETGWLTQADSDLLLLDKDSEATYEIQLADVNILVSIGDESFALNADSLHWTTTIFSESTDSKTCSSFSDLPRKGEARVRGVSYEGFDAHGSVRSVGLNLNLNSTWNAQTKMLDEVSGQWAQNGDWTVFMVETEWLGNQGAKGTCQQKELANKADMVGEGCHRRDDLWAESAVRTSFPMMQTILGLLERNPACGFSSARVTNHPTVAGEMGFDEGSVTYEIQSPCLIDLREATPVAENCHGEITEASGGVWVTGTKTIRGWITGNATQPVIPTGTESTTYQLELQFEDFHFQAPHFPAITYRSGNLKGELTPVFGLNDKTGVCNADTARLSMTNMEWTDAEVSIHLEAGTFQTDFTKTTFQGVRGASSQGVNSFNGLLQAHDDVEVHLPLDNKGGYVDASYLRYQDSVQCAPSMVYDPSPEQCDYLEVLAQKAGQALLESVSHATQYVHNDNQICGFSASQVAEGTMETEGLSGDAGRQSWKTGTCPNNLDAVVVSENCTGGQVLLAGGFEFQGQKLEEGLLTTENGISRIVPQTHDALAFEISNLSFQDFQLETRGSSAHGWQTFETFEIETGSLQGTYRPIRGANAELASEYNVSTPVAQFEEITVEEAVTTLHVEGGRFRVEIDEGVLSGTRGAFNGSANEIFGRLLINGRWVQLEHVPFDPSFEQESFDAEYTCTPNLLGPIPKD